MKTQLQSFLLAVLTFVALPALAQQAPLTFTYQGTLTDQAGAAVNGTRSVHFRIYDLAVGGEALWSETHESVDVVDGLLSVDVGAVTEIGGNLPTDRVLYLGVQVADDTEIAPRMRIGGALRARFATVAAQALDVRGQDIHPATVSIVDSLVIDAAGRWVGSTDGLQGPQGEQGIQGPQGLQGAQGPVGPQGAPGPQGPVGERGLPGQSIVLDRDSDQDGFNDWLEVMLGYEPGDANSTPIDDNFDGVPDILVGPAGSRGPRGTRGTAGPAGPEGNQGPQGARGEQGATGPEGLRGPAGPQGPRGLAGASVIIDLDSDADGFADWLENALGTDPTDINSAPADDDQDGIADALRGLRGAKGDQGPAGAQGPEGPQGNVGPEGPIGNTGPAYDATIDTDLDGFSDWVELLAGTDPLVGGDVVDDDQDGIPDGLRGPAGPIGATGVQGPVGPAGRDGATPLTDIFEETVIYQGAAVDIPRADLSGEDVTLDIDVEGLIEADSFKVSLDITHPDLSALEVLLIAPDATAYSLVDGPTTGVGGANLRVTFPDDLAPLTDFEQGEKSVVGKQARGTWILRVLDTDFGNAGADRKVNGFSIAFTRKAQAAWRLEGDLHVNGSVFAQNTCTLVAATENGQALAGVVEMQCGDAAPIRLYAFSCGNGALDPGESCDDGNQMPGDGCDARCITE